MKVLKLFGSDKFTSIKRYFSAILLASSLSVGCDNGTIFYSSDAMASVNSQSSINVTVDGSSRSLPDNPICFNVNTLMVDDWDNPTMLAAVKELEIDLLRIPGGTVANYWSWKRGGILVEPTGYSEMPRQFKRRRVTQYTSGKLENYSALFEATGADGMLVLNMLSSNLEVQMEFIRKALEQGLPIKYVELGNEFYEAKPQYIQAFPSAESYAQEAARWAKAIKSEFSYLKIGIVGVNPRVGHMKGAKRLASWNDIIIEKSLPHADALTLHEYQRRQDQRAVSQPEAFNKLLQNLLISSRGLLDEGTSNRFPSDKKIWITEYNLIPGRRTASIAGRWIHGFYVALMTASFLEEPGINIACNHVLVGDSRYGALFADEKVIGSDIFATPQNQRTSTVKPYNLSASGRSIALYSRAIRNKQRAIRLHFSESNANSEQKSLYGWIFEKDQMDKDAIIFNLSDKPVILAKPAFFAEGQAKFEQLSANPELVITSDAELSDLSGLVPDTINLPPYSITRIYSR